ncbi:MAG: S66 peptidase family protein [Gemmatimonadota bacterium]
MAKARPSGNYHDMISENRLRPPRLQQGSRVALIAPAGPLAEERIDLSLERCRSLGLEPVLGAAARKRSGYFAGHDQERTADLQTAIADPSIDAIWALRGGYGTMRLLEHVGFAPLRVRPKAFVGFSDNTTLHLTFFNAGLISFHGPHPGGDFPPETRAAFERVLFYDEPAGRLPLRAQDPAPRTLRAGRARGPLIGGNLSVLAAACGTAGCMQARGCIVFIEDVSEPAYRIDRALTQLLLSGAFVGVAGFAFGRFTEAPPSENDRPIADVLFEFADRLAVPAVLDFPIGHIEHNWTLPVGVPAELDAGAATLAIVEPAVR